MINNCQFHENNWSIMIKIVVNIKRVQLLFMEMEEKEACSCYRTKMGTNGK